MTEAEDLQAIADAVARYNKNRCIIPLGFGRTLVDKFGHACALCGTRLPKGCTMQTVRLHHGPDLSRGNSFEYVVCLDRLACQFKVSVRSAHA